MKNIIIDFDGVIYDSIKRFIDIYNNEYLDKVDYKTCKTWNFKECKKIQDRQEIFKIFDRDDFYFEDEKYFIKDSIRAVNYLSQKSNVTIATCGTNKSNFNKQSLCEKVFPNCNFIGITNSSSFEIGKDAIFGDYIIDDHIKNLETNKSRNKLLFEPNKMDWNSSWVGEVIKTWTEFVGIIEFEEDDV